MRQVEPIDKNSTEYAGTLGERRISNEKDGLFSSLFSSP
jgi:hypothetical protein